MELTLQSPVSSQLYRWLEAMEYADYLRVVRGPSLELGQGVSLSRSKPTNPKDSIGVSKLNLDLVPDTLEAYAALAFIEGASKYGSYNWRSAGVRASIYHAAAKRHLKKWWNGEWADKQTSVPHLSSVLACIGIILDAKVAGKLTDDRPPALDMDNLITQLEEIASKVKALNSDKNPHHHTELDKQKEKVVE